MSDEIRLHCGECGHEWTAAYDAKQRFDQQLAIMRNVVLSGCPKCGKNMDAVKVGPKAA